MRKKHDVVLFLLMNLPKEVEVIPDRRLSRSKQHALKREIRRRLSLPSTKPKIPKPKVRYKLRTVKLWWKEPTSTVWK